MNVERLQVQLRDFAEERDWGRFHTPKNLAMALSVEASELLEIFQWLTPEESQRVMAGPQAEDVKDEVADILIYLLRLTDVLGVDLDSVVAAKVARNASRFPPVDDG
ncbi:nucleotide pyrophosphohydrolase [Ornithinimicrobium avium]|uniref:Nucleotide pyrophosphohydrolase n=1 Tax=Ornithinimicrobium avium TaxID=2283195 RepID=A0A345NSA8_9MICO|nr:nucleotide pyrophosphohydrolase [Ornithinimicrobium avium]AXH97916.1 nucleotide pyrophosphohydrolase [Ornithinimicrobium avium]